MVSTTWTLLLWRFCKTLEETEMWTNYSVNAKVYHGTLYMLIEKQVENKVEK